MASRIVLTVFASQVLVLDAQVVIQPCVEPNDPTPRPFDKFNGTDGYLPFVPVFLHGYDVMEYFINNESIRGDGTYAYNHTSKDQYGIERIYQFWFINESNMNKFVSNPYQYIPQYGGFCCWGIACEYPWDGYENWSVNNLGPPAGASTESYGWKIYNNSLYFAIFHQVVDWMFDSPYNVTYVEGANARWIKWFGSLNEGVLNYMCLHTKDIIAENYCYYFGQPYAPAVDSKKEIFMPLNINHPKHKNIVENYIVKGVWR